MRAWVIFVRMPLEGGGYKYLSVGFGWNFNLSKTEKDSTWKKLCSFNILIKWLPTYRKIIDADK